MITLDTIDALARPHCLAVFGALHPGAEDGAPGGTGTIVLIGPSEPGFWPPVDRYQGFRQLRDGPDNSEALKVMEVNENRVPECLGNPAILPMGRGGIEPPTPGFSVLCSTN